MGFSIDLLHVGLNLPLPPSRFRRSDTACGEGGRGVQRVYAIYLHLSNYLGVSLME